MAALAAAPDPRLTEALKALGAGRPADVTRAVDLLEAAARDGDAAALARLAALAAAGVGMARDFDRALDLLVDAATLGCRDAQTQLKALAAGWDDAPMDAAPWPDLRARVRLDAWVSPRAKVVLNRSPRVVAIEAFLPRAVCPRLIALATGRLTRARVYGPTGEARLEAGRSNTAFEFAFIDCDVVTHLTRARIAAILGVPAGALESSQILHYDVGEAFAPHHDYLDPARPGAAAEIAARGQRMSTLLIYLNEGYDGGETAFPRLDLRHRGGAGDALYFANLDAAGAGDPRTLHSGLAPTRGEKWVFSQWIRNLARA
jgi:hypothetical protein